jgi:hypothetical protein
VRGGPDLHSDSKRQALEIARLNEVVLAQGEALAAAQRTIEAAKRELERASDVRANRTRIIGNTHLILQGGASLSNSPTTKEEA